MTIQSILKLNIDASHDPLYNMALDNQLNKLRKEQLPVLRVYGWKYPAISIGSNQSFLTVKSLIGNLNVPFYVKRVSPGGCFYHYDEIMLCFIVSKYSLSSDFSIAGLSLFSRAIRKTLNLMGIHTQRFSPEKEKNFTPFQRSSYDLYDQKRKPVAIFAFHHGSSRMLIHASVLCHRLSEYSFFLNKEEDFLINEFCTILSQIMVELYKFPGVKEWQYSDKVKEQAFETAPDFSLS